MSEDHPVHLACNVAFLVWATMNGIISQDDFGLRLSAEETNGRP